MIEDFTRLSKILEKIQRGQNPLAPPSKHKIFPPIATRLKRYKGQQIKKGKKLKSLEVGNARENSSHGNTLP